MVANNFTNTNRHGPPTQSLPNFAYYECLKVWSVVSTCTSKNISLNTVNCAKAVMHDSHMLGATNQDYVLVCMHLWTAKQVEPQVSSMLVYMYIAMQAAGFAIKNHTGLSHRYIYMFLFLIFIFACKFTLCSQSVRHTLHLVRSV